ncbi:GIY-YIG nuclease family protein [Vibrio ostreicida]|uniref:GIY-YIG nuclease family protein n=1 Tax=Vibrio ostreicida TaxID=526588 RepID=UPI0009702CC1|nr:GIY-YIG nuclease family protein [Vibrio ostreicida]
METELGDPRSLWYVYFIRTRSNALYCGITTDVERRYQQHCNGTGAKALRGKGPLSLVWFDRIGPCRGRASKIEFQLKQLSKKQKERLVTGHILLADVVKA